jgi:hypothetical protein
LVVWFLAFRHVIGNWTFTLVTIALAVLLPRIGAVVRPTAFGRQPVTVDGWGDGPLELVGFAQPFSDQDLHHIDGALGLEETPV